MRIYTYLQGGWADWECGYVLAGLRRNLGCEVVVASPNGTPVTSIGGLRVAADVRFDSIEPSPDAGYLLIGSDDWLEFDRSSVAAHAHDRERQSTSVLSIKAVIEGVPEVIARRRLRALAWTLMEHLNTAPPSGRLWSGVSGFNSDGKS